LNFKENIYNSHFSGILSAYHNLKGNFMPDSPYDRARAILLEANLRLPRRLTFQQKCAAYALLQCDYSKHAVAVVFDMSDMTAARLMQASETNRIHPDVAKEFNRLGSEEFGRLYLTDEILTKVQRAVLGLKQKSRIFDPTADHSSGWWEVRADDEPQAFCVRWMDGEGWAFANNQDVHPGRYFTSSIARTAGYKAYNALRQRPIRISEAEARAIWKKTSNEVNKNLDKQNQEE
jgi:hypothetical protein